MRQLAPYRLRRERAHFFAVSPMQKPSDLRALDGAMEQLPPEATVQRDWTIAKVWLFGHVEGSASL